MKRWLLGAGLVLAFSGCGGGDGVSSPSVTVAPEPTLPRGSLLLEQDLILEDGPGSGVPVEVRELQLTPLDAEGRDLEQTQIQSPLAGSALFSFPLETRQLNLTYVLESGEMQTLTLPVQLSSQERTVLTIDEDPTAPVVFVRHEELGQSRGEADGYTMLAESIPIRIKGVGFDYTTDADFGSGKWFPYVDPQIFQMGSNTIRTYGVGWNFKNPQQQAAQISAMLALCKQKKTYLLAGLVFDPAQGNMNVLIPQTVDLVRQDPNFDRMLGWCIGNEIPPSQFPALNSVITLVKKSNKSPKTDRPIMTAVPTVSAGFVATIQSQLPALDWLGINNFYGQFDSAHKGGGFLNQQTENLVKGGWKKPWAITEYYSYDLPAQDMPHVNLNGTNYWLELNSTLNAANYSRSYQDYVVSAPALKAGSVGGCVLNFGPPHNSKLPAFWKMTHAYRGQFKAFVNPPWTGGSSVDRLQCVDAVATLYGGKVGTKTCPQIALLDGDPQGIACDFKASLSRPNPPKVARGQKLTARCKAVDSGAVTFDWYLIGGTATTSEGDINGASKDPFNYGGVTSKFLGNGTTDASNVNTITFDAPQAAPGNVYQLRVILRDGQGGAATAAIAFPMQ